MIDSPAISSRTEPEGDGGASAPMFMNIRFFKLSHAYRKLLTNERVVAKQEFLSAYDRFGDQMPLAAYTVCGLDTEADLMLWRVSPRLESFVQMSARLLDAGLGRYLDPVRSYLGTVEGAGYERMPDPDKNIPGPIGRTRYLSVLALEPADGLRLKEAAGQAAERLHLIDERGLSAQSAVAVLEAVEPSELQKLLAGLSEPPRGPVHTCLFGKIGDIVDGLG